MNKPNFFIIGSAKSGTSSLYNYLKQHPEISMSSKKEPHYYSRRASEISGSLCNFSHREDPLQTGVRCPDDASTSSRDYFKLFSEVRHEKAIGESSISYLTTSGVAQLIRREAPNAKIVAILRNPVERAYSAYLYMRRHGQETLCFRDGLEAEEARSRANCHEMYHYRRMSLYYERINEYVQSFPPEQRFFVTYDYWIENRAEFFKRLFGFLGVQDNVEIDHRLHYNVSGGLRSRRLHEWSVSPCRWRRAIGKHVPDELKLTAKLWLGKWNRKPKQAIPEECRAELALFFLSDIEKLEGLLGWDLSSWKNQ